MADWNVWDTRYSEIECAYGSEPNEFLKEQLNLLSPGYLLLPGEGEGRNALWAAKKGWKVSAFDFSIEAVNKATKMFQKENVAVKYNHSSVETFQPDNKFDVIGLIFLHLPSELRINFFQKIKYWLNPGGKIILECFNPEQLGRFSGGPKDPDLFPSLDDLILNFEGLNVELITKQEVLLNEGPLHQGQAIVTRLIASKQY